MKEDRQDKKRTLGKMVKLANILDKKGMKKEAELIDSLFITKQAKSWFSPSRIAGNMTPEQIAEIAEGMPADKLAQIAKQMDKSKQQQVVALLMDDPEMQSLAMSVVPPDRVVSMAKSMDKEKQKEIMLLLIQDPAMQAVAMEAVGLPSSLTGPIGNVMEDIAEVVTPTQEAPPTIEELKKLFAQSGPNTHKVVVSGSGDSNGSS